METDKEKNRSRSQDCVRVYVETQLMTMIGHEEVQQSYE
jgi:hypothetical protein